MTLKLSSKEFLVDNVWAFRFKPSEPVNWVPGQFMRVELPHDSPDEEGTRRWFTVSSAPYEGLMQITTRVTGSTFKQALYSLEPGDEINLLELPHGEFVWQDSPTPLVFVAGGIGITPFRSIIKQRVHDGAKINATLVYGNRTDAIVFRDEFEEWADTNLGLKVLYEIGAPLTAARLLELVPKLRESLVYVSGPKPMCEGLCDQLTAVGIPDSQIKRDFFPNYNESNY